MIKVVKYRQKWPMKVIFEDWTGNFFSAFWIFFVSFRPN